MDRTTVFTKTAKGLMEATGKTSVLSRDMRALLKEVDGKATVGDVQAKLGKVPEAKLLAALQGLVNNDFIREFKQSKTGAPPQSTAAPQAPPRSISTSISPRRFRRYPRWQKKPKTRPGRKPRPQQPKRRRALRPKRPRRRKPKQKQRPRPRR